MSIAVEFETQKLMQFLQPLTEHLQAVGRLSNPSQVDCYTSVNPTV